MTAALTPEVLAGLRFVAGGETPGNVQISPALLIALLDRVEALEKALVAQGAVTKFMGLSGWHSDWCLERRVEHGAKDCPPSCAQARKALGHE